MTLKKPAAKFKARTGRKPAAKTAVKVYEQLKTFRFDPEPYIIDRFYRGDEPPASGLFVYLPLRGEKWDDMKVGESRPFTGQTMLRRIA